MTDTAQFFIYLLAMAGSTYLIRLLPLLFCKKKIENRFIRSFLYYVPYAVLSAMTFPAILYATDSLLSAGAALLIALLLAYREKSLLTVAACACAAVFLCELVMRFA